VTYTFYILFLDRFLFTKNIAKFIFEDPFGTYEISIGYHDILSPKPSHARLSTKIWCVFSFSYFALSSSKAISFVFLNTFPPFGLFWENH
jgi:hypothetical protein